MSKAHSNWKPWQQFLCRLFGYTNKGWVYDVPECSPGEKTPWSVEAKHRKKLPNYIHEGMQQAEVQAAKDQIPVLGLHQKGDKYEESYIVMRVKTFREYFV